MRGKVDLPIIEAENIRITPAYAGKRGYDKFTEIGYKDHPRLCGEKVQKGSSC